MLAFGAVVVSVELGNLRFNEYCAGAHQKSEAWRRILDLLVYLAGIATNLVTIIFSTLTGAVVSDLFKSVPNAEITSILVLVTLFLSVPQSRPPASPSVRPPSESTHRAAPLFWVLGTPRSVFRLAQSAVADPGAAPGAR